MSITACLANQFCSNWKWWYWVGSTRMGTAVSKGQNRYLEVFVSEAGVCIELCYWIWVTAERLLHCLNCISGTCQVLVVLPIYLNTYTLQEIDFLNLFVAVCVPSTKYSSWYKSKRVLQILNTLSCSEYSNSSVPATDSELGKNLKC